MLTWIVIHLAIVISFNSLNEMDYWILSRLHSLIKNVEAYYEDYEPTRAARLIQSFVIRRP